MTTLTGFVTPRNILFTPDGTQILISDSTRGDVAVVDADTFKEVAAIPIGAGVRNRRRSRGPTSLCQQPGLEHGYGPSRPPPSTDASPSSPAFPNPAIGGVKLESRRRLDSLSPTSPATRITVVETATLKSVGGDRRFRWRHRHLDLPSTTRTLYAASPVAQLDLGRRSEVRTAIRASVPVGRDPYGAAPEALTVDAFTLATRSTTLLTVIDTGTNKPVRTIAGFDEPRRGDHRICRSRARSRTSSTRISASPSSTSKPRKSSIPYARTTNHWELGLLQLPSPASLVDTSGSCEAR